MSTKARAASAGGKSTLTLLQERFVTAYGAHGNGAKAYTEAGGSERGAKQSALKLLKNPVVMEAIQAAQDARLTELNVTASMLHRKWWELSNVDVREIIEFRYTCCRYCWGRGHKYHWTPAEFERATQKVEQQNLGKQGKCFPLPDCEGGTDFNRTRDPNPECPECSGEGDGRVKMNDTRNLSPAAAQLYSGVHASKDGLKALIEARDRSRENIARSIGMFKDGGAPGTKDGSAIIIEGGLPDDA
jgi:phage terminase small subunit